MRRGDFGAARAVNDAVLAIRAGRPDDPRLPYHLRHVWGGRPFDGRDVLVRCYHGLGDTLQFIRFLPALRARAASVTLEAQPELVSLLRGFPGVDRLIRFDVTAPAPPSECDIEVMELAHALRLGPDAVGVPYLAPTLARPGFVGPGEGPVLGICASAGDWDRDRSIPPAWLTEALPEAARLVRLQPDEAGLAWLNPGPLGGLSETAALIAAVDLVITVDTMVAHLAGALGRPGCVLLKADADWRWMSGAVSDWYPTLRLYRQFRPGDWGPPLDALRAELALRAPGRDAAAMAMT